jgi:hypothetical protein
MKYTSRNPNGINQITGSAVAITVLNNDVAVFTTSSLNLSGSLTASSALITGNVTVLGTASINTLVVNQTQLSTGSNQLGDAANDTQTLYGTVVIPTGSLTVSGSSIMSGSLNVTGGITGSFSGSGTIESASFASTASYVNPLVQNVNITGSLNVTGSGFILNPANQIAGLSIVSPPTAGGSLVLSTIGSPGVNNGAYLILRHADGTFPTPSSTDNVRIISTQDSQYFNGTSYITSTKIVDISEGQKIFGVTPSFGGTLTYYGKLSKGNWYFGDLSSTINTARDTSVNARVQIKGSGTTSATTAFRVENANASGSMVVLDDGNVGIGIAAPLKPLHINTNNNDTTLSFRISNDNAGGRAGLTFNLPNNTNQNWSIGASDTRAFVIADGVSLQSNPSLTILPGGNVGIGTTTPSYKLDVSGSGNFTNNLTVTGSFTVTTGSLIEFQVNQTGVKIGNATTDSHAVTGSVSISGSLLIGENSSSLYTSRTTIINSGSTALYSIPTSSYDAVYFDYVIKSGSNARAGQVFSTYITTASTYIDNSTSDIGNTSVFYFSSSISSSNLVLHGSTTSDGWKVKTIIRGL